MKKTLVISFSLLLVMAICVCGAFCAVADNGDEAIYGTYENGIVPSGRYVDTKIPPTDKFMNGDFELGLKYWVTRGTGRAPSEAAKLITEGDNTYIEFTPQSEYDGIITPPFVVEEAKIGMNLVVFFKWRGEGGMQIVVEHQNGTEKNSRVSVGAPKLLQESTEEGGWNLSMSPATNPVMELKEGIIDETHRFQIYAQVTNDVEAKIQIDDLKLCIYKKDTNKLYELDGTTVVADIAALEAAQQEADANDDSVNDSDFTFDVDDSSQSDNTVGERNTDNDSNTETSTDTDNSDDSADETSKGLGVWLWVIISTGVVVVAAVVVVIVLKKKKSTLEVAAEETPANED